ncbi:MAG: carbon monoxide dehydrogenase subunit G [Pseudomonadota bacterium]
MRQEPSPSLLFSGQFDLPADRSRVWQAVTDPDVLSACINHCERVDRLSDEDYEAVFSFRIGPVRKSLTAKLRIADIDAPAHYQLTTVLEAGRVGAVSGCADVSLENTSAGCRLGYSATAELSGWFSRLNQTFLQGAVDRYMSRFFKRLIAEIDATSG